MNTALAENKPAQIEKSSRPIPGRPTARENVDLNAAEPVVSILGSQYRVELGSGSHPRFHQVSKNKTCSCGVSDCEAILAVRQYLLSGGVRAPDPEGLFPCPICGSKTYRDRTWDGKYTKVLGWRCERGGLRHFLEAKADHIRKQFAQKHQYNPPD